MELTEAQLLEVAFDASDQAVELPATLETGLLERIRRAEIRPRHRSWAGRPAGYSPLDAAVDTASDLGGLLDSLGPPEWTAATRIEGATVRDLVLHLVGVERYLLGQLDRGPVLVAPRREDHWPVTRAAGSALEELPGDQLTRRWWASVLELISTCTELGPDQAVAFHHLGGTVSDLLVARTFELWTHGDDIRQATGRPLDLLDDERLTLMVASLMDNLALGMALEGTTRSDRTVRFELHGAGGGTFVSAMTPGQVAGAPDLVVSTTTIELCRVAAHRLDLGRFEGTVEGDAALLEPVMAGVSAFAAD